MGDLIDYPSALLNLSQDELTEVLLDDKYNKANLRQLIRSCLAELKSTRELVKYLDTERAKTVNKLTKIRKILGDDDE